MELREWPCDNGTVDVVDAAVGSDDFDCGGSAVVFQNLPASVARAVCMHAPLVHAHANLSECLAQAQDGIVHATRWQLAQDAARRLLMEAATPADPRAL